MSSWRGRGGVTKSDSYNSINVNAIVANTLTLKDYYYGNFDILGNIKATGSIEVQSNIISNYVAAENLFANTSLKVLKSATVYGNSAVKNDFYTFNRMILGNIEGSGNVISFIQNDNYGNYLINQAIITNLRNGVTEQYLVGKIGFNTNNPQAALDVHSDLEQTFNVHSSMPMNFNVIARNAADTGIVTYTDDQTSSLRFHHETAMDGGLVEPDGIIEYKRGGNLHLDVNGNTVVHSKMIVSDQQKEAHIFNNTMTIYDPSNSPALLPSIYESPASIGGQALGLIARDTHSSVIMNMTTPDKKGYTIIGGAYPPEPSRSMGAFGLLDTNGLYRHAMTMVTSDNHLHTRNTMGINTTFPVTNDNRVLDIVGATHIRSGETGLLLQSDFEILNYTISKNAPNYLLALGMPYTLVGDADTVQNVYDDSGNVIASFNKNYQQKLIFSNNAGRTWYSSNFNDTDIGLTYNTFKGLYAYDASLSFVGANYAYLFFTNNGGLSWFSVDLTNTPAVNMSIVAIHVTLVPATPNTMRVFIVGTSPTLGSMAYWFDVSTAIYGYTSGFAPSSDDGHIEFPDGFTAINAIGTPNFLYVISQNTVRKHTLFGSTPLTYVLSKTTPNFEVFTDIDAYGDDYVAISAQVVSQDINPVTELVENVYIGAIIFTTTGGEIVDNVSWNQYIGDVSYNTFLMDLQLNSVYVYDTNRSIIAGYNAVTQSSILLYSIDTFQSWNFITASQLRESSAPDSLLYSDAITNVFMPTEKSIQFVNTTSHYNYTQNIRGSSLIYNCHLPEIFSPETNYVLNLSGGLMVDGNVHVNHNIVIDKTAVMQDAVITGLAQINTLVITGNGTLDNLTLTGKGVFPQGIIVDGSGDTTSAFTSLTATGFCDLFYLNVTGDATLLNATVDDYVDTANLYVGTYASIQELSVATDATVVGNLQVDMTTNTSYLNVDNTTTTNYLLGGNATIQNNMAANSVLAEQADINNLNVYTDAIVENLYGNNNVLNRLFVNVDASLNQLQVYNNAWFKNIYGNTDTRLHDLWVDGNSRLYKLWVSDDSVLNHTYSQNLDNAHLLTTDYGRANHLVVDADASLNYLWVSTTSDLNDLNVYGTTHAVDTFNSGNTRIAGNLQVIKHTGLYTLSVTGVSTMMDDVTVYANVHVTQDVTVDSTTHTHDLVGNGQSTFNNVYVGGYFEGENLTINHVLDTDVLNATTMVRTTAFESTTDASTNNLTANIATAQHLVVDQTALIKDMTVYGNSMLENVFVNSYAILPETEVTGNIFMDARAIMYTASVDTSLNTLDFVSTGLSKQHHVVMDGSAAIAYSDTARADIQSLEVHHDASMSTVYIQTLTNIDASINNLQVRNDALIYGNTAVSGNTTTTQMTTTGRLTTLADASINSLHVPTTAVIHDISNSTLASASIRVGALVANTAQSTTDTTTDQYVLNDLLVYHDASANGNVYAGNLTVNGLATLNALRVNDGSFNTLFVGQTTEMVGKLTGVDASFVTLGTRDLSASDVEVSSKITTRELMTLGNSVTVGNVSVIGNVSTANLSTGGTVNAGNLISTNVFSTTMQITDTGNVNNLYGNVGTFNLINVGKINISNLFSDHAVINDTGLLDVSGVASFKRDVSMNSNLWINGALVSNTDVSFNTNLAVNTVNANTVVASGKYVGDVSANHANIGKLVVQDVSINGVLDIYTLHHISNLVTDTATTGDASSNTLYVSGVSNLNNVNVSGTGNLTTGNIGTANVTRMNAGNARITGDLSSNRVFVNDLLSIKDMVSTGTLTLQNVNVLGTFTTATNVEQVQTLNDVIVQGNFTINSTAKTKYLSAVSMTDLSTNGAFQSSGSATFHTGYTAFGTARVADLSANGTVYANRYATTSNNAGPIAFISDTLFNNLSANNAQITSAVVRDVSLNGVATMQRLVGYDVSASNVRLSNMTALNDASFNGTVTFNNSIQGWGDASFNVLNATKLNAISELNVSQFANVKYLNTTDDASLNGNVFLKDGAFLGQPYYQLRTTSQSVSFPSINLSAFTSSQFVTISFWMYVDAGYNGVDSEVMFSMTQSGRTPATTNLLQYSASSVSFYITSISNIIPITTNQFVLYTLVLPVSFVSGDTRFGKIYINGTYASNYRHIYNILPNANTIFNYGAISYNPDKLRMRDFRLYSGELSASAVSALYAGTLATTPLFLDTSMPYNNLITKAYTNLVVSSDIVGNRDMYVLGDASLNNVRTSGNVQLQRLTMLGDASLNNTTVNGVLTTRQPFIALDDVSLNAVTRTQSLIANDRATFNKGMTLFMDASLNGLLSVQGDAQFNQRVDMRGDVSLNNLYVNGIASFKTVQIQNTSNGDGNFTGEVGIIGNTVIGKKLTVGQDLSATSLFVTAGSTFNGAVTGLSDVSLNARLAVNSDVSFNRNLRVLGDASFNTATVGGLATFRNNVVVGGDVTTIGNTTTSGAISAGGNLTVSGTTVAITGNTNVGGRLAVGSVVSTTSDISANGNVVAGGNVTATNGASVGAGGLTVTGSTALLGAKTTIAGDASMNAGVAVNGNVVLRNTLNVWENTQIQRNLVVGDNTQYYKFNGITSAITLAPADFTSLSVGATVTVTFWVYISSSWLTNGSTNGYANILNAYDPVDNITRNIVYWNNDVSQKCLVVAGNTTKIPIVLDRFNLISIQLPVCDSATTTAVSPIGIFSVPSNAQPQTITIPTTGAGTAAQNLYRFLTSRAMTFSLGAFNQPVGIYYRDMRVFRSGAITPADVMSLYYGIGNPSIQPAQWYPLLPISDVTKPGYQTGKTYNAVSNTCDGTLNTMGVTFVYAGTSEIVADSYLRGNVDISKNVVIAGGLSVVGTASFTAPLALSNQLVVNSGIVAVNDVSFNKNAKIGGSINVGADASFNANMLVLGNAEARGNVSVSQGLLVSGNTAVRQGLDVSGSVVIDGSMNVGNGVKISRDLVVSGNTALAGNVVSSQNMFVSQTISAMDASLNGNVVIAGNTAVRQRLDVSGNLTADGSATVGGNTTVGRSVFVGADVSANGGLAVGGLLKSATLQTTSNATVGGNLAITGNTTMSDPLRVQDNATVDGVLTVGGISVFNEKVILNGDLSLNGVFKFAGAISYDSVNVTNDVSLNRYLLVGNNASFNRNISALGDLSLNGTATIGGHVYSRGMIASVGDASFNGNLFVGRNTTHYGTMVNHGDVSLNTLRVGQSATFYDTVTTLGNLNAGNITLTGSTTISYDLTVNQTIYSNGNLNVNGNLNLTKNIRHQPTVAGSVISFEDTAGSFIVKPITNIQNTLTADRLRIMNDASFNGNVFVIGNLIASSTQFSSDITTQGNVVYSGRLLQNGTAVNRLSNTTFVGDVSMNNNLILNNGTLVSQTTLGKLNSFVTPSDSAITWANAGTFSAGINVAGGTLAVGGTDIFARVNTWSGDATFGNITVNASKTLTLAGSLVVNGVTLTPTQVSYLSGATSNLQTQITNLPATMLSSTNSWTGDNTFGNITLGANKIFTVNGSISTGTKTVSKDEIGHLSGVTSGIQSQFTAVNANVTALTTTVNGLPTLSANNQWTGNHTWGSATTTTWNGTATFGNTITTNGNLAVNANVLVGGTVITPTVFSYLNGTNSNIQQQLNTITSSATTLTNTVNSLPTASGTNTWTGTNTFSNVVLGRTATDTITIAGNVSVSNGTIVRPIEIASLSGITSNIQTQLNGLASKSGNNTWTGINTFNEAVAVNAGKSITFGDTATNPVQLVLRSGTNSTNTFSLGYSSTGDGAITANTPTNGTFVFNHGSVNPFTVMKNGIQLNGNLYVDGLTIPSATLNKIRYLSNVSSDVDASIRAITNNDVIFNGNVTMSSTKVLTVTGGIKIDNPSATVTPTQLSYLAGCTSDIQGQLNALPQLGIYNTWDGTNIYNKLVTMKSGLSIDSGGLSIGASGLTINGGGLSLAGGNFNISTNIIAATKSVTPTELSYLSGVTSNIQTQFGGVGKLDTTNTWIRTNTFSGDITLNGNVNVNANINLNANINVTAGGTTYGITPAELSYLDGLTYNVQTKLTQLTAQVNSVTGSTVSTASNNNWTGTNSYQGNTYFGLSAPYSSYYFSGSASDVISIMQTATPVVTSSQVIRTASVTSTPTSSTTVTVTYLTVNTSVTNTTIGVSELIIGTNDLTIEWFMNFSSMTNAYMFAIANPDFSNIQLSIKFISATQLQLIQNNETTTLTISSITNGNWYHFALCRSSSNIYLYLNGNKISSAITSPSIASTPNYNLYIGKSFNGYLTGFTYVHGYAFTTGTNYTIPTSLYTQSGFKINAKNVSYTLPDVYMPTLNVSTNSKTYSYSYGGLSNMLCSFNALNTNGNKSQRVDKTVQITNFIYTFSCYGFIYAGGTQGTTTISYVYIPGNYLIPFPSSQVPNPILTANVFDVNTIITADINSLSTTASSTTKPAANPSGGSTTKFKIKTANSGTTDNPANQLFKKLVTSGTPAINTTNIIGKASNVAGAYGLQTQAYQFDPSFGPTTLSIDSAGAAAAIPITCSSDSAVCNNLTVPILTATEIGIPTPSKTSTTITIPSTLIISNSNIPTIYYNSYYDTQGNYVSISNITCNNIGITGTLTCGALTSTTITTNNNAINCGTGTLTCGALTSTTITTNNNAINCGTGTLTCGALTSTTITTNNNAINCGTGALTCGALTSSAQVSAISFNATSDRRLKTNITPISTQLENIKTITPCTFDWKTSGKSDLGFIAQDIFKLYPDLRPELNCRDGTDIDEPVDENDAPVYYGLDYGKLTTVLWKGLQEATEIIETQKSEIDELKSQMKLVMAKLANV